MNVLPTSRLIMRPLAPDDLPALCRTLQDPIAMVAYEGPFTTERVAQWIDRNRQRYTQDGTGLWAVLLAETGQLIGQCGLVRQNLEGEDFWEIGYLFERAHWGHGYATEAALAWRDYAFTQRNVPAVYSIIKHDNLASQRVALRCGMAPLRPVEYGATLADKNHLLFGLENPHFCQP